MMPNAKIHAALAERISDRCLQAVRRVSPVVDDVLHQHANATLKAYVSALCARTSPPRDGLVDLQRVVASLCAPLLGDSVACAVEAEFANGATVLTTNHHGVDYFAQSLQGTIIFSRRQVDDSATNANVVLACGAVPLDNLTYPQGMLIYDQNGDGLAPRPRKLPIFANSKRRQLVSMAPAMDAGMVKRASDRLHKWVTENEVSAVIGKHAGDLLSDIYSRPCTLGLPTYSQQASVINAEMWRRIVPESAVEAPLVYLELEKVSAALLGEDLLDEASLAHRVLFDDELCRQVVLELNQQPACWDLDVLAARLASTQAGTPMPAGGGSVLLWAVAPGGRPIPLQLMSGDNGPRLAGVDSKGAPFEVELQPEPIVAGLKAGRLLPSLFLSFLSLTFHRGVNCLGGYYQADYLPRMAGGLSRALASAGGETVDSWDLDLLPTDGYLSGMQSVVALEEGGVFPIGPVEIISAGGLSLADLDVIDGTTVMDAHLASLLESVGDLPVARELGSGWQRALASDLRERLGDRVLRMDTATGRK